MKYPVYKSLDKKSSLFGIQGSYLYIVIIGAVLAVIVGFGIVGGITGSRILGTVVFVVMAVAGYFVTMTIQGNFTERELKRKLTSMKIPDFCLMRRNPFRGIPRSREEFYGRKCGNKQR